MVATQKSRDQKETRLGTLVHEEDAEQVDTFERAGKERIDREERKRGMRSVDGVIHKPKRLKWAGKPGLTRGPYQGKRQKRIPVLDARGVPPLTSEAFDDVYLSFHRMNARVDELALKATWRLVLSPWLRAARRHQQGRVSRTPNFVTPYVLAVVAAHYLFTSTADTDLARAFQVRRDLWSFLQEHVPVTEAQANAIGFDDCWLEGRAYPERYVGYTAKAGSVHKSYYRLVRLWVQNEDQQVWLKPTPKVPALTGFVPVYERRRKEGSKKKIRVQVNKEDNARARRAKARLEKQLVYAAAQLNGANGEATGKDDVPSLEEILAKYGIHTAATNKLRDHWLKCVAQLMLAVGTDHVEDIIQLATHQCDYRMLTVCPSCYELDFSEHATEHDVDTYDRLWCEKWYSCYCRSCVEAHQTSRCTTLNGAQGEATNKDDVKRRGTKKPKNKPKQRGRAATIVVKRKMTNRPRPTTNLFERQYRLALADPFNPDARGAKCTINPWQYTVPYCIRWKGRIKVPTGGTNMVILQPNPTFYGWSNTDGTNPTMIDSILGPMTQVSLNSLYGLNGALLSNFTAGTTVDAIISSQLANYRVVGGGIVLRSILSNNMGQCMTTAVPVLMQNSDISWVSLQDGTYNKNNDPGYWAESGGGATFVQQEMLGSIYTTSNILSMGGAKSFTTYDLLMNEASYTFSPVTPEAFHFNDCGSENVTFTNSQNQTVRPGDIMDWEATGDVTHGVARRGMTDVAGWSGVILKNNTTANGNFSTYELDYVLHIEGQPRMAGQPPPAMSNDIPAGSETSILSFARQFRRVAVTAVQNAGATAGRALLNEALRTLQTSVGGVSRMRAIEL